ncbi:xaa-Arg dipeptidase-like isoform X2 [Dermacentor albipictus]|uniref:xaa-Arg dipeptidase-like isoform X2 n=1 Tax=Dermacentor albipictus TaxID=60249 RepID=UPI0038FC919E
MAGDLKELVHNVVEANSQDLWELSRFVWEHPEVAFNEVQCHGWLTDFLERRGFNVTRRYLLDTAFKAEFGAPGGTEGPCVALLCEYDALPDIGHACGHNLIAEASVGAALAVCEAMKNHQDIRGKVVVLGTPAEESRCGKELLIRKGALQGVDAALMAHPAPHDIVAIGFAASQQLSLRFRGKTAHAGAWPWEGLSALDAAVAAYVNVSLLRLQLKPTNRIHGVSFLDDVVKNLPPTGGGTDCGNVSHRVPAIHPVFAVPAAKGSANHTRGFAAVANAADSQPPTLRVAKVLALTALDLLADAELLREAKREFAALQLPSEEELQSALS